MGLVFLTYITLKTSTHAAKNKLDKFTDGFSAHKILIKCKSFTFISHFIRISTLFSNSRQGETFNQVSFSAESCHARLSVEFCCLLSSSGELTVWWWAWHFALCINISPVSVSLILRSCYEYANREEGRAQFHPAGMSCREFSTAQPFHKLGSDSPTGSLLRMFPRFLGLGNEISLVTDETCSFTTRDHPWVSLRMQQLQHTKHN